MVFTGDIGTLDSEGVLTLSGRASDLIISGGYNIYPKEVEQALDEDPRILESAVVGQPDEEWGETVVAFVVLEEGEESAAFEPPDLSGRLAGFKRPRRWEVVADLPRNAMGKVGKEPAPSARWLSFLSSAPTHRRLEEREFSICRRSVAGEARVKARRARRTG